jgi:hypothetical protein
LDRVLLGDFLVLSSVDLGKGNSRFNTLKGLSGGGVFGLQFLAMSAPGSIEFNEHHGVSSHSFVEIVISEYQDTIV